MFACKLRVSEDVNQWIVMLKSSSSSSSSSLWPVNTDVSQHSADRIIAHLQADSIRYHTDAF